MNKKTLLSIALCCLSTSFSFGQSKPLPYASGFDNTAEKAGWQQYRLGFSSPNKWAYDNSNSCSQPTVLYHDYNVGGKSTDTVKDWYVSPPLKITGPSTLRFKLSTTIFGTAVSVWFAKSIKDPSKGHYIKLLDTSFSPSNRACLDISARLTTIADSGYIAFKYVGSNYNYFSIDNVLIALDSTTGMNNQKESLSLPLQISPNPSNTYLVLDLGMNQAAPLSVQITDITGKELLKKDFSASDAAHSLQLEIKEIPAGLHFISVFKDGQRVASNKFIKME